MLNPFKLGLLVFHINFKMKLNQSPPKTLYSPIADTQRDLAVRRQPHRPIFWYGSSYWWYWWWWWCWWRCCFLLSPTVLLLLFRRVEKHSVGGGGLGESRFIFPTPALLCLLFISNSVQKRTHSLNSNVSFVDPFDVFSLNLQSHRSIGAFQYFMQFLLSLVFFSHDYCT